MSASPHQTTEFIRLLTNHQTALRGLIISMLPGSQDVNDILQDTNVVLWEKMSNYKQGTNFKSWAYAVARNKVMQYWDKQKKLSKTILSEEMLSAVAEARKDDTPEWVEQKLNALNQCMAKLKSSDQAIVQARYSEHGGLKSYSTNNGRPSASVRVSLYRIRQKLKTCIDKRIHLKGEQA